MRQDLLVQAKDCPLMSGTAIGTILPNFQWLPDSTSTFSVEIKPKCGFLPQSTLIHPQNSIKHRVCRYQLHQHLKHEQVRTCYRLTKVIKYINSYIRVHVIIYVQNWQCWRRAKLQGSALTCPPTFLVGMMTFRLPLYQPCWRIHRTISGSG